MRRHSSFLAALFGTLSALAALDPCALSFARLASRRFVLDNELTLCAYRPETAVAASVQYPVLTNAALRVVGGFWPAARYMARVTSLPAEIAFATAAGDVKMRVAVDAATKDLPAVPFDLSVVVTGDQRPAVLATKAGRTALLDLARIPAGFVPSLKTNLQTVKFCVSTNVTAAAASLTAGIGQADVRFVTTGRENRLYMEGRRAFFTFSSRAYGACQGVASFDPSLFDVRLEGIVLFDYGDGKLRNDLASHLFYDDVDGFWKGYACNFSTGTAELGRRAEGGVNAVWSETNPLHGLSVMRAKSLGLKGMNEDPCATWDGKAKRWSLFVSEFTPRGIRASLLQSRSWDGVFVNVAGPVEQDSTGTTIAWIDGVRYCFTGSAERACYVYSYPDLKMKGRLAFDFPPWDGTCANGRVWPCVAELPEGYPFRFVLLTMDRANFPGMPRPNWTYGGLCFYGANP
ncbi:MAG: hypothetical protein ACI4Q3_07995 [Kiritimatiellia bacterium]